MLHGIILGNIVTTVLCMVGMMLGFDAPPLKYIVGGWIALDVILAFGFALA